MTMLSSSDARRQKHRKASLMMIRCDSSVAKEEVQGEDEVEQGPCGKWQGSESSGDALEKLQR